MLSSTTDRRRRPREAHAPSPSDAPLSLFDVAAGEAPRPPARLPDHRQITAAVASGSSDTSKAAARKALPNSGTQRHRVLCYIAEAGDEGATDEEMQVALRLGHNSQTPRRRELVQDGWITDSGKRRRTASTDSPAAVWVLTERARQEMAQAS